MKSINKVVFLTIFLVDSSISVIGQYQVERDTIKNIYDSTYCIHYRNSIYDSNNFLLEGLNTIKCYYNNGVLKEEFNRLKRETINGFYKSYYQNGGLKKIYNVIQGRRVGYYLEYYPNGNLKIIGYYENFNNLTETLKCDTNIYDDSQSGMTIEEVTCDFVSLKTGEWIYYDINGEVNKIEQYENGIVTSPKKTE